MSKKALLFINGEAPKQLPEIDDFQLIACTDGAFHYLRERKFPLDKIDFISGDFDSFLMQDEFREKRIHTPDQNKTDFHKALEIIVEKGGAEVSVYGASGKEQDHFLGNLHTAYLFKNQLDICFYDEFASYFFAENHTILNNVKGKMISLIPFPEAKNIYTKGLHWVLNGGNLSLTERIGTRNRADEDVVEIEYKEGALVLFVEN
ncbi:MAG: thiamine diphosphokinase [Flavobacteriaceae bacterium]|nr:thiamine diphosphokinase [Flavobacteriaceae bacterium]